MKCRNAHARSKKLDAQEHHREKNEISNKQTQQKQSNRAPVASDSISPSSSSPTDVLPSTFASPSTSPVVPSPSMSPVVPSPSPSSASSSTPVAPKDM